MYPLDSEGEWKRLIMLKELLTYDTSGSGHLKVWIKKNIVPVLSVNR